MAWQYVRTEKSIIREEREKLGLTQQEVADLASIQLRQYQRFETGERNLSSASFFTACKVMKALGLDPTLYFRGQYVLSGEVEASGESPGQKA